MSAATVVRDVIHLGKLALQLGRVERITRHEDGVVPEMVTDHTVMLGLVACAFAEQYLPQLDRGKIAQYALVHDLVEVYAGDTPTLRALTASQKADKTAHEMAAQNRIESELPGLPWVTRTIDAYEDWADVESRYVKAIDKLLPKITHILNGGRTLQNEGVDLAALLERYDHQGEEMFDYCADIVPVLDLRRELINRLSDDLRAQEGAMA